ncbi:MAG: hypothetical protein MUE56_01315 [Ignavibacteria bacterium]|jgi:hypothetical protein|nr:hypothetical protein [Ignavibacteria bacterium]
MKLIISTIISTIVIFILGWLGYGIILKDFFVLMSKFMRPENDMKWWALIVGHILQGLLLSYFYMKIYKGESPLGEGFKYGFSVGLLISLPYLFFMWSSYNVTYQEAIVDAVYMGIRYLIAGIVIGLVFGKKSKTETV